MNKVLKISDDSGFLGLVNVNDYNSFVNENWEFDELQQRFVQEMNRGTLLFWSTGQEGFWTVRITSDKGEQTPFRTTTGKINVTGGTLFLTNYEDLSMAAQFHDQKLPLRHNSALNFEIENGNYEIQINQLFNPDDFQEAGIDKLHFEIIVKTSLDGHINNFVRIPWQQ